MIYILVFSLMGLVFLLAEKSEKIIIKISKYKKVSPLNFFACIAIIFPTLLAGLRAKTIGADVMSYVYYTFERVRSYNSLKQLFEKRNIEVGYELLCFFSTRVSDNLNFFHFVTALLIIFCIYIFAKSWKEKASITFIMLTFMFLYFNVSLNIVRQFIAISIYLVSSRFLMEEKYIKYLIGVAIAICFHTSAVIAIPIAILYFFLNKNNHTKQRDFIVVCIFGLLVFTMQWGVNVLYKYGFVPLQYVNYFENGGNSSFFMQIISRGPVLILGFWLYDDMNKHDSKNHIIYMFLIIDCILGAMAPIMGDASRISLYFGVWQCLFIPELYRVICNKIKYTNKIIVLILFLTVLFAYWYYCYIFRNFANTSPYISDYVKWLNLF